MPLIDRASYVKQANEQLMLLTRKWHGGAIDKETYRQQRREILEFLLEQEEIYQRTTIEMKRFVTQPMLKATAAPRASLVHSVIRWFK